MNEIEESGFAGSGRQKAELVCPTCGRTAPLGEWTVTERDVEDRIELSYECPECSTVVVTQPRFERSEHARPA